MHSTLINRNLDEAKEVGAAEGQHDPAPPLSTESMPSSGLGRRILRVARQWSSPAPGSGASSTGAIPVVGLVRASQ